MAVIAPAAVGRGEEKSLRARKAVFMQGTAERAPDQEISSYFTQMGKLGQVHSFSGPLILSSVKKGDGVNDPGGPFQLKS